MHNKLAKIVIHTGSHKAGSTSIQDFCCENKSALLQANIHYPVGLFEQFPRQHSHLARLLGRGAVEEIRAAFDKVRMDAEAQGANIVFLSGEDLCTLKDKHVILLSSICDEYFEAKEFVFVVRNRRDFLLSQLKHNLTHGPQVTENEYLRKFHFSPRDSYNAWKAHFSSSGKIVLYDEISSDLIQGFFRAALVIDVRQAKFSNASHDMLTISIINMFLKDKWTPEIDKIMWNLTQNHRERIGFQIEEKYADDMVARSDESDWILDELEDPRKLVREAKPQRQGHDPVAVCDKMIDLFGALKRHFEAQPKGG
ncbi:hypothetical protein [Methylocystis parvus]|uniref:hypothetical protein n=1 Tax=Methylocystis parvus TaxID=134 RepID=UPI003C70E656